MFSFKESMFIKFYYEKNVSRVVPRETFLYNIISPFDPIGNDSGTVAKC